MTFYYGYSNTMVPMSERGPEEPTEFVGAKVALINDGRVLTLLRDGPPNKHFPNVWDLPGGSREVGEQPMQTLVREVREELGIDIKPSEIIWEYAYPSAIDDGQTVYFMVSGITDEQLRSIVFGDEGEGWQMLHLEEFINHGNVVPGLQQCLKKYLQGSGADSVSSN